MKKLSLSVALFACLLSLPFTLLWAEDQDKESSYKLEQINVSGKNIKEPVASRYAVPESSSLQTEVFTRQEIEAIHPESVLDVLQFSPGIEITFQGRKQFDFTNIRGQGSLGVVIDGAYLAPGPFTQRILATFPVDNIESITVVRDSSALTLGPLTNFGSGNGSSNQGFVVIKTKRALKLEGGFVANYGSFHTDKEYVYQGAKISDFDYMLGYTHQDSPGKTGWYNGMRNNSLNFRTGYTGKMVSADVFYFASRGMREMQRGEAYNGTLSDAKWKYDPQQSTLIGFNMSKPWNNRQTTTFGYSFNSVDFDFISSSFSNQAKVTSTADSTEWGQAFDLRHVIAFDKNTLRMGGQYLSQRTSQDMYSLYVHDQQQFFSDRLTVDGGIRADKKYYRESPVTSTDMNEWAKEVYTYAVGAAGKYCAYYAKTKEVV